MLHDMKIKYINILTTYNKSKKISNFIKGIGILQVIFLFIEAYSQAENYIINKFNDKELFNITN